MILQCQDPFGSIKPEPHSEMLKKLFPITSKHTDVKVEKID